MNHLNKLLKQERLNKGMTMKELAKLSGMTHLQQIQNYESGKCVVPLKHIKKICKALGVSKTDACLAYRADSVKHFYEKWKG